MTEKSDKRAREQAIAKALTGSQKVLVLSHKNPDGDALGSTLGLGLALKAMGKEVEMVNVSGVPEHLSWLPGAELITTSPDRSEGYDAVAILDCSELERTGFASKEIGTHLHHVVIDHHPRDFDPLDTELVDTSAAAAGQLVYDILRIMDAPMGAESATNLYVALHTDTGGFRFSNTDSEAFIIAAQLTVAGASPSHVSSMLFDREKASRTKLLGLALGTLDLTECGRIADITVTREMYGATGTGGEDTDGFVNFTRSIEGVEVGLIFKELEANVYRVGLRSRGRVNVSTIAASFGGGGHKNASGATIEGTVEEVRAKLRPLILQALDAS